MVRDVMHDPICPFRGGRPNRHHTAARFRACPIGSPPGTLPILHLTCISKSGRFVYALGNPIDWVSPRQPPICTGRSHDMGIWRALRLSLHFMARLTTLRCKASQSFAIITLSWKMLLEKSRTVPLYCTWDNNRSLTKDSDFQTISLLTKSGMSGTLHN
jgi:hypothetical protein